MIPSTIFWIALERTWVLNKRAGIWTEEFLNETTHQMQTTHLHLYKQGFTSLAMDNYQLKKPHISPLLSHSSEEQ